MMQKPDEGMAKIAAAKSDAFHKPNRVMHAANGMVDLTERPFAFKGFAKEFYSRNQSPIAYDPAAKCPRFLNELLRPALCGEDITLLQNWCGLALLGRNIPQVMLILSGTAGGGKGTIAVTYQGKTYYVCCSGCRSEFNENPQKYIDEYHAKKAKKTK